MALEFGNTGYEGLFREALSNGINIFCGAGFSLEAEEAEGKKLPDGKALLDELKQEFASIKKFENLSKACTKLTLGDRERFYLFLERRFKVSKFSDLYYALFNIKINNIYTTNIDDLFFELYAKQGGIYQLQDRSRRGGNYVKVDRYGREASDRYVVNYYPLHGCIRNQGGYVFGVTEIASAFSQKDMRRSWRSLGQDASNSPMLFWGWNFEDAGPIEAMYGGDSEISKNINRWALLYNPDEENMEYLESLGFNVIKGSTIEMLQYLNDFKSKDLAEDSDYIEDKETQIFLKNLCPPPNDRNLPAYPMEMFFKEYTPRWSQIYTRRIPKLSHFKRIADAIAAQKNVIIYGVRCSGKTTMLMQLMLEESISKRIRHYMVSPSLEQAERYVKALGKRKSLLFIDDAFRDTEVLLLLL